METNVKPQPVPSTDQPGVEAMRLRLAMNQARDNQNPGMAIAGGFCAAVVGACLWAVISYYTEHQIGWMAVGVGFLVGWTVRTFGHGIDTGYGIIGAVLSLFGCALGNVLAICGLIARQESLRFSEVYSRVDLSIAVDLLRAAFSPIDLLFAGLALYYGFKYSRIKVESLQSPSKPSQSL
ncbi:hypothetical protein C3F09_07965 [candidate division GN15 bacterium]|uniref:Uncharacterized protein n=1 Tax=candidate division GN15 bacterium TaxID=2072418 RepID=A0A855X4Z2_9BACT|nr:MAG: hypothetical protein C3F09_07965 [candidate division GN15 bacterium]